MYSFLKKSVNNTLQSFGLKLLRIRKDGTPPDFDDKESAAIRKYDEYTMTSHEKMKVLIDNVNYVCKMGIAGDFVEAGVWRGGSSMIAADAFMANKDIRHMYLFDAFDMKIPAPLDMDKNEAGDTILGGATEPQEYWNAITEEEVKSNMISTKYPESHIHTIKGLVNDTIPSHAPEQICILRLDTDTYESSVHNLKHLYPRLSPGGILFIDDYGSHAGVRQAVDEFVDAQKDQKICLIRVDSSGVVAIK